MGLGWTRSPTSVFLVFVLITLETIFNPVSIIAIFKAQTWKAKEKRQDREQTSCSRCSGWNRHEGMLK